MANGAAQTWWRQIEWRRVGVSLTVAPFLLFAVLFMILPAGSLLIESFRNAQGQWTLANFADMNDPMIIEAYAMSLRISFTTAIIGAILGLLVAYAITVGGLPHGIRTAILTVSGVASNFAGVPLAFAFVATLGRTGIITALLAQLGINLYKNGFNLYSYAGLVLVYVYFQFPLMVLVMTPALDGLRREWREASAILGANTAQYWWHVALPILMPAILAGMVLLFGNAFGAFATAYALTGGTFTMVTNVIAQEMSGDVLHNEALAYALATGMIVIMTITIGTYTLLQRRAERWLRA